MAFSDFWVQFSALCWKNRVLKLRHYSILILELALPTIIILALWFISNIVAPTVTKISIPHQANWISYLDQVGHIAPCQYEPYSSLIWDCQQVTSCPPSYPNFLHEDVIKNLGCKRNYIAVAPQSNDPIAYSAAREFVAWAESDTCERNEGNNIPCRNANLTDATFVLYESEAAVIDLVMSENYVVNSAGKLLSSAIIFKTGYPNWEYTLRFNSSVVPPTTLPDVDISVKTNIEGDDGQGNGGMPFLDQYMYNSQSFVLTNIINSFVATETCRSAGVCETNTNITMNMQGAVPFPNPEVSSQGFWAAVGGSFAILMIITLLYPISNMVKSLVTEKETRIREGMLMMAMRSDALWLSWIVNFIGLLLPLSILLTLAGSKLFLYSDKSIVFIYFFVFFLASMSYAIFISQFFSKSRTASILGSLIFFLGWFIFLGLKTTGTRGQIMVAALHPALGTYAEVHVPFVSFVCFVWHYTSLPFLPTFLPSYLVAFTYATTAFQEYEDAQLGVTKFTWNTSSMYPCTFQDVR